MHGKNPVLHPDALELASILSDKGRWEAIEQRIALSGAPTNLQSTDAKLSEKLDRVETDLAAKRDERVAANAELESAKETYANSDAELSSDSDEFKAVKDARAKVGSIDDRIQDLTNVQVETLKAL